MNNYLFKPIYKLLIENNNLLLQYTQKQAKTFGIRGWCMNTSEGTVVGALEGEKAKIDLM